MKLKKFVQNKKQKKILIGSIVSILFLIGGLLLYKTFALYEEKEEFNVLKGVIPEFIVNDVELAVMVDGESTKEVPSKGNYYVDVTCDNGADGKWDYENWNITIGNLTSTKVKCMLDFKSPGVIISQKENTAFWQYRENITKIVFENKIEEKKNASYTFDVSEAQNGSVMSYLVSNETDASTYTLYIQGNGGIKANRNSNFLFYKFTNVESIENIEYLDTSNVTNMYEMFGECKNLETLDLTTFDTHNVTSFVSMFIRCQSLKNLNISNFDTSKAIDMTCMFKSVGLEILDISSFDISNVTGVHQMFLDMEKNATIYVKDENMINWILNVRDQNGAIIYTSGWTEDNFAIKG